MANPLNPRTPPITGGGSGGIGNATTWPLSIVAQAAAIDAAVKQYAVPIQVFMGMYTVETALGTLRNSDGSIQHSNAKPPAIGPFQFTGADKNTGVIYPMTSTPNFGEFRQQAAAAAAYLKALYKQAPAPAHNWHYALMSYNAGPGGAARGLGASYADNALAAGNHIPAVWKAALGGQIGTLGPANAGGISGRGGTGTLLNDQLNGFRVGDATNPDEDYWTAINRLSQERYWYVFSDSETLYLADGPDLMKQTPALEVDRVRNAGNISHLEMTWDNSAWSYAVTHKKRRHSQRRTQLAKVTSPVEAQLNYICAIDEVRAGDVVTMAQTGPGDGQWLVGDVRRSVFEVSSEINLVQALTPLTEGALNPAGINTQNSSTLLGTVSSKGYVNPVGLWRPSRVDAGVDGTLDSAYVAPGDSHILVARARDPGWQGGGYVAGMFTSGDLKGKVWYVAEGIFPVVPQGAQVKAGTAVARLVPSPYNGITGNIETGWAVPTIPALPLGFLNNKDDQGSVAMTAGRSFNRFLVKLGAKPGFEESPGIHAPSGNLPAGYP